MKKKNPENRLKPLVPGNPVPPSQRPFVAAVRDLQTGHHVLCDLTEQYQIGGHIGEIIIGNYASQTRNILQLQRNAVGNLRGLTCAVNAATASKDSLSSIATIGRFIVGDYTWANFQGYHILNGAQYLIRAEKLFIL
jgi:hypothetical protein